MKSAMRLPRKKRDSLVFSGAFWRPFFFGLIREYSLHEKMQELCLCVHLNQNPLACTHAIIEHILLFLGLIYNFLVASKSNSIAKYNNQNRKPHDTRA
jgi:hypothetical protein